jgi:hypothetical protein
MATATAEATAETTVPPSGEGTVVLDIGGGRGAAVLFTPASLSGREIEIRPADGPWAGTHTGIRQRDLRDTRCFAAVFGSLAAGRYQVRVRGTHAGTVLDLVVPDGAIVECSWPEDPAAGTTA